MKENKISYEQIKSGIRIKSPRKNAVEREPVETRVRNPNASEASYKPKQRCYRKTKLKKYYFLFIFFFRGDFILEPLKVSIAYF